ncbi:hypothetical protein AB6T85_21475 [Erwinia sp. ACCC 02193]|uniref:RNA polymerase alpha subunit C-terminal domain-containing protein n=1 Tax=Erwinia aeris TaxID=3239803 RepID=A0ABV4EDI9_9GAMM
MSTMAAGQAQDFGPDMGLIAEQIGLIAHGIAFCTKRVAGDDVFRARMERMGDEVTALAQDFERYAHREIADYDQLAEAAECNDRKMVALRLELNLLQGNVNRLNDELAATGKLHESALRAAENTGTQLRAEIQSLTARYQNELTQANGRANRADEERRAALTQNAELVSKLHKELNAHVDSRKLLQRTTREKDVLQAALDVVYKEHDAINGFTSDKVWKGLKNPRLSFYMHTFNYPLKYPHDPRDIDTPRFVNNLHFHINIRTTYGVDLVTRLDEWGMVQYQTLDLFKGEIPADLFNALISAHHEIVAIRNPHMKRFFDWAHTFPLTNLPGLTDANRSLLKKELEVSNLAQLGCCFTSDLMRLKGVGEATARKWRALAYEQGAAWMKEHGVVELEKTMTGITAAALPAPLASRPTKPKIGRSKKHRKGKR